MRIKIKKWQYFLMLAFLGYFTSCNKKKGTHLASQSKIDTTSIKYIPPPIPISIRDTPQSIDYLAEHYWDSISFTDTIYLHTRDMIEQTWCNYCYLLCKVSPSVASKSIKRMIKSADAARPMFKRIVELAEKYLYDPNSPMRNEDHYILILQQIVNSTSLNDTEKIRPKEQLKLAMKNRYGQKANNFRYTLASGQKSYLYQIKAEFVLIFFNNPGCHACRETISYLKQAPAVNQMFDSGKLKILSLYTDDEIDYWRKHLNEFPKQWICAYDKEMRIRDKQVYDLKAIPTLYLLNNKKIVLLKDATPQQVENYLQTHQ